MAPKLIPQAFFKYSESYKYQPKLFLEQTKDVVTEVSVCEDLNIKTYNIFLQSCCQSTRRWEQNHQPIRGDPF